MRTVLIAVVAALLAGASGAYAGTAHIFGSGGKQYTFDAMCHRTVVLPPGISDHEALNFLAQQVKCLVRRPDPFARCVRQLTFHVVETADHGPGKPGDISGAKAALNGLKDCASAHL